MSEKDLAMELFSGKDLKKMIVPLFFEQLLAMLVGLADTLMISGEEAVAGVSLVNQFNTIFIYLFTALASGGAVVISQYIGRKDAKNAGRASSQLLMFSVVFSIITSTAVLLRNENLLTLLFGKVEAGVMNACVIYLKISAYSYPALAVYNAGAAVFRSLGDTKITMRVSIIANIINIAGNFIGVYGLKAGVAGVAVPSLISRIFSAAVVTILCFGKKNDVKYDLKEIFSIDRKMLKNILKIAVPNGAENGIFQLVKVALSSIVALFGTYQIAVNGAAQSIWSLAALMGVSMSAVYTTVIGQCMGAGNAAAADHYFRKLTKLTIILSTAWNAFILALTPVILLFYSFDEATKQLVFELVLLHNIFNALAFPLSGALSSGLRAAGDVKFTMIVSIASTVGGRLVLSYVFGVIFGWGVLGIAAAMVVDWLVRAAVFALRERSGKWKECRVI